MAPLNPARLAKLLTAVVAALESEARAISGGAPAAAIYTVRELALRAVADLELACHVSETANTAAEAAVGAGRVPLPSPSAEVEAALDGLARLIAALAGPYAACARVTADLALKAVHALAFSSPRRVAALARHAALTGALVAALGVRGDPALLVSTTTAAMAVLSAGSRGAAAAALWRDGQSGANMRALAVAYAGAFGARELFTSPEAFVLAPTALERVVATTLTPAILACAEADRLGFCAAMLRQPGFTDSLCACIARSAAALPPPGAAGAAGAPFSGALVLASALGSGADAALEIECDDALQTVGLYPRLEMGLSPPGTPPFAEQLLAAAPALLGRVADVFVASAPWFKAVAAALGPDGPPGGAGRARLVSGFDGLQDGLWVWAVELLQLTPVRALTAAGAARRALARLAPPLLGLAEAAQAVAGAPPGSGSDGLTPELRDLSGLVAAVCVDLFGEATKALGGAAPVLLGGAPDALAALVRLSALEPPLLLADGSSLRTLETVVDSVFNYHGVVRAQATSALSSLAASGASPRLVALLAASPALLQALGAAVDATPTERRFATGGGFIAAKRRALAAALVARLVESAAAGAGQDASCLRRALTGCRPFLAGCDDALRQANALRSGGGGSNSGFGNPGVATWVKTAGKNAHEALLAIAQSGGAAALEELRSAAAPFPAVLRALEAVVVEEGSAAAAASTAAAAAASSPSSAAAAAGEAAPPACAACGAAAAPLRCGGCRRARYCGAECQKRDWRAHKAACKQQRR